MDEFSRSPSGTWTANRLVELNAQMPVIRRDPATGSLVAAFIVASGGSIQPGIYVMTGPGS